MLFQRNKIRIGPKWYFAADPMDLGKGEIPKLRDEIPSIEPPHNFHIDGMTPAKVPGDWNHIRGFENYEGIGWYVCKFNGGTKKGKRAILYFEGMNHKADVFLNGEKVGSHIGGFMQFAFDVTDKLKEKNLLAVKIDNKASNLDIPPIQTDWYNYGGMLRPVWIAHVEKTFICDLCVTTLKLTRNGAEAKIEVALDGADKRGTVRVVCKELGLDQKIAVVGSKGSAKVQVPAKPWSPESPKLYKFRATYKNDVLEDDVGFRTIAVKGMEILLNGSPVFLRGICMHEEAPGRGGRSLTQADADKLLGKAKELGCNFVRLAHYPHTEIMVRTAEKLGLMVWDEIPLYWRPIFTDKGVIKQCTDGIDQLIARDRNRAAVIIWSVCNETPWEKGCETRNALVLKLIKQVRKLDPSRLVSYAGMIEFPKGKKNICDLTDKMCNHVDIVGINEYLGWYNYPPNKIKNVKFKYKFKKPLMFTEVGGDGVGGYRGPKTKRWTEDFQAAIYEEQIKWWKKSIPALRAVSPWILMDFRTPFRQNQHQLGYNRKGLVDRSFKHKKAFAILQKFYREMKRKYA